MSKYGFAKNIETEVNTCEERETHETVVYRTPTLKEYALQKKQQAKAWAKSHPRLTKGLVIGAGALAFAKAVTSVATKAVANAMDGMEVQINIKDYDEWAKTHPKK